MNMKKMNVQRPLAFLLGLILLALGVVVAVKANYGATVATSPAYVLSLKFTDMTLGTFNYLIQGMVFVIMILMIRRVQMKHVFSFATNVFFGFVIDLFVIMLQGVVMVTHVQRVSGFLVSIVLIGLGLAFFIRSELPMLPFDMFVRELSLKIGKRIGIVKTTFDLTLATSSLIMSLLFFGGIKGIHFGTLISALTIGTAIDIALHLFDRWIQIDTTKSRTLVSALEKQIVSFRRRDEETVNR